MLLSVALAAAGRALGAGTGRSLACEAVLLKAATLEGASWAPGRILAVRILVISGDPRVREWMGLVARTFARSRGEQPELLEASDGIKALKLAARLPPDVVVADEITSRAGAFAVTRDLKGGAVPFAGRVVVFLEREQDAWLAAWSGADAWFVKPVNPFEVADTITGFFEQGQKEAV